MFASWLPNQQLQVGFASALSLLLQAEASSKSVARCGQYRSLRPEMGHRRLVERSHHRCKSTDPTAAFFSNCEHAQLKSRAWNEFASVNEKRPGFKSLRSGMTGRPGQSRLKQWTRFLPMTESTLASSSQPRSCSKRSTSC